jgi:hypothetical protein
MGEPGERTFPGGYFVRRPPFSWGFAPSPGEPNSPYRRDAALFSPETR